MRVEMTDERPPTHHRQDGKQAEVELAAERSLGAVVQHPGGFAQCCLRALDVISVEPLGSRGVDGQVLGIFALRVDGRHGDQWRVARSKYTMAGKSKLRSRLLGARLTASFPVVSIPLYRYDRNRPAREGTKVLAHK